MLLVIWRNWKLKDLIVTQHAMILFCANISYWYNTHRCVGLSKNAEQITEFNDLYSIYFSITYWYLCTFHVWQNKFNSQFALTSITSFLKRETAQKWRALKATYLCKADYWLWIKRNRPFPCVFDLFKSCQSFWFEDKASYSSKKDLHTLLMHIKKAPNA